MYRTTVHNRNNHKMGWGPENDRKRVFQPILKGRGENQFQEHDLKMSDLRSWVQPLYERERERNNYIERFFSRNHR